MRLRAVGKSQSAEAPCASSAPARVSERAHCIFLLTLDKERDVEFVDTDVRIGGLHGSYTRYSTS